MQNLPVNVHALMREHGAPSSLLDAEMAKSYVQATAKPVRWTSLGTQWPRVGGRGFRAAPRDCFLSSAYSKRYRPGIIRIIYVANCAGLRALADVIKMPIAKISTCGEDRLVSRLKEESADFYGAAWMRSDGDLVVEPGWDAWDATLLRPVVGPAPNSPVSVTSRAIVVRLPEGMTANQFDEIWDAMTRHAAIDRWAGTRAGIAHFAKIGVEPAIAKRRTVYEYDTQSRVSCVREICAYRLSQDADRLIALAESIILQFLGLLG